MKKILISGSCGFVGSHFVEHIQKNTDWHIIGIDSFRHKGDSLRIYQDPQRYDVDCHDLASPISDRMINKIGHIDYIVNFASESHVDRSITDPVPFVENNIKLMLTMLEYARKIKPEKFIQISTDEIYSAAPDGMYFPEWSTILPSNPYSASKAAQESLCISYFRTYGLPVIITNCTNIFGERQDAEKYIPKIISSINKNAAITVHGDKYGIGSRFYLHARNKSDALLFLLQRQSVTIFDEINHPIPDRYNIAGDVEVDNLEIALKIAKIMGKELKYEITDSYLTRPGHDRRYALDDSKIHRLGWKPPIPFAEALERTVKWTLKNPEWLL